MARHALHQRSDSDTNVRASAPNSDNASSNSSSKPSAVSQAPSRSSTSSSGGRGKYFSKHHKSQKSAASNHSSTTGGTVSSRSNTVRSNVSVDSLPPVPPLRIYKQRISLPVFQDDYSSDVATNSGRYAKETGMGGASGSVDESYAADAMDPHQNPTAPQRIAPALPRSILKKPSKAALPPYTEDDYRRQSSIWVDRQETEFIPNRARMNAQTLRLVNNVVGTDLGESSTQGGAIGAGAGAIGAGSPGAGVVMAGGILRTASRVGRSRSQSASTTDMLNDPNARPTTPSGAKQFPAWARYFYGQKGGRTSVIVPNTESTGPISGGYISSPEDRRPPTGHSMMSISEIPRYFMRPRELRPRDPDATTLWSLPHLDHPPIKHITTINRQVIFFCLGFMLPVFWWIAAFLPLPEGGEITADDLEAGVGAANFVIPKEARKAEMAFERRVANARWWRRVNRVLSVVGVIIVAAIIVLVALAFHTT